MAYAGGFGSPNDSRNNPFSQRRQYDTDSDLGDHYGNPTSSTTHLAASQQYYEQRGSGTYLQTHTLGRLFLSFLQNQSLDIPIIPLSILIPASLPSLTLGLPPMNRIRHGLRKNRFQCLQKKLKIYFLTLLRSSVSNAILCGIWCARPSFFSANLEPNLS